MAWKRSVDERVQDEYVTFVTNLLREWGKAYLLAPPPTGFGLGAIKSGVIQILERVDDPQELDWHTIWGNLSRTDYDFIDDFITDLEAQRLIPSLPPEAHLPEVPEIPEDLGIDLPDINDPYYSQKMEMAISDLAKRLESAEKTAEKVRLTVKGKTKWYTSSGVTRLIEKIIDEVKSEEQRKFKEKEEELKRQLARKQEAMVKMVTVRFRKDMPSFMGSDQKLYGPFKTGDIASLPEGNAAILMQKGIVEAWAIGLPPPRVVERIVEKRVTVPEKPRKPGELTGAEINRLKDAFRDRIFRDLGRVPSAAMSTFRVEVEKVKTRPYSEAEDHILGVAQEVIVMKSGLTRRLERAKPRERITPFKPPMEIAPEEREPDVFVIGPRVPSASIPTSQLCYNIAWPRFLCRQEKMAVRDAFQYDLQEKGFNWADHIVQRSFQEHIIDQKFNSWRDFYNYYLKFLDSVTTGKPLPLYFANELKNLRQGWEGDVERDGVLPPERIRVNSILQSLVSVISNRRMRKNKMRKKMVKRLGRAVTEQELDSAVEDEYGTLAEALFDRFAEWGVDSDVTLEEVKKIAEQAFKENDVWIIGASPEEVDALI